MITLDQVLLLEQKVESAVKKITQLQQENDALRTKCDELTNALSNKSEQLSSFEQDQNKIETGILKALERLNAIENSVLKAVPEIKIPETKKTQEKTNEGASSPKAQQQVKAEKPSSPSQSSSVSSTQSSSSIQEQFDIF